MISLGAAALLLGVLFFSFIVGMSIMVIYHVAGKKVS